MLPVFIRNNLTDRSLKPLRAQMASQIPDGARVVDAGCANGRLLLENAERLERGLGIDRDQNMIAYARRQADTHALENLQFAQADVLTALDGLPFQPTHALASLFLHALRPVEAIEVTKKLAGHAPTVIIADLVEPGSILDKAFLHFDEWIAGHRDRYIAYRDAGGMPAILEAADLPVDERLSAAVPGVRIWVCRRPGGPGAK